MEEQIKNFPKQLAKGYELAGSTGTEFKDNEFKNIIIAGMGGSGLPGNILKVLAEHLNIAMPVYSRKTYGIPHTASKASLIVAISYSGNTEETLSAYSEAVENNIPVITITTGGELAEKAKENSTPLAIIPSGIQPRMALGYQFSALLRVLENAGVISSQEAAIKELSEKLDAEKYLKDAGNIAESIKGTVPVIYSSAELEKISYILKIQVNENAKQHAFYNMFPEMNHNELEGFEAENKGFSAIIITSNSDNERVKQRMKLSSELMEKKGYPVHAIDFNEDNIYNKVFSIALFGYWMSYTLALKNNIEPEPVELIEEFKSSLR